MDWTANIRTSNAAGIVLSWAPEIEARGKTPDGIEYAKYSKSVFRNGHSNWKGQKQVVRWAAFDGQTIHYGETRREAIDLARKAVTHG